MLEGSAIFPRSHQPMRILVVATHIKVPDAHGGSTHVGELVGNLRRLGPTLLLARNGSSGPDVVGVCFYAKHPPWGLKHALAASYFPKSYRAAKAFKPDVIYAVSYTHLTLPTSDLV